MNTIEYRAYTLTNLVYAIFRLECFILPALFIVGRNPFFPKIFLEKVFLGVFTVAALSGTMWAFEYLNYYSFRELLDNEKMFTWQAITTNYIAANRLMWGTTSVAGVILSLITSALYLIATLFMHMRCKLVAKCFTVILIFRFVGAMICIAAGGDMTVYAEWFVNNTSWLLSSLFMVIALWAATKSEKFWIKKIWGEELRNDFEDDEE